MCACMYVCLHGCVHAVLWVCTDLCACARGCAWEYVCVHAYACVCARASPLRLHPEGMAAATSAAGPIHPPPRHRSRALELAWGGSQQDRDAGLSGSTAWMLPIRASMVSQLPGRALAPAALDAQREPGSGCAMAPTPESMPRSRGATGAQLGSRGTALPPAAVAPGPAARPAASCAGAHCSAAPGCGAGFLCQSSAIFYSNN